jgi:hypothetical protein
MISAWTLSLRAFAIAVGSIGIGWGFAELSMFRREAINNNIAKRIIAGDPFKPQILLKQASVVEQAQKTETCRPLTVRSAAVMRLRIAEISNDPGLGPAPDRTNLAVEAIRNSLACSPSDPFLWLVLYALQPSAPLSYLSTSYRLGPSEGWIALKRNPVAFGVFDELPEDLRGMVVQEFLRLLEIDLYDEAVKIFVGPAWEKRELILSQMDRVPLWNRQNFAARLDDGGYDVIVPGVSKPTR